MNIEDSALALYDGDWRSEDYQQMVEEFDLSEDEAEEICAVLATKELN